MKLLRQFDSQHERIWAVAFSPNGQYFATANAGGEIHVYEVQKNFSHLQTIRLGFCTRSICFSDNSQKLIVGCYNKNIYIYILMENDFQPFATLDQAHSKEIKCVASRKRLIASCGRDRRVCVWRSMPDAEDDFDCLSVFELHTQDVKSVFFGGRRLCSTSYDNTVQVYCEDYVDGELEYKPEASYKSPIGAEEQKYVENELGGTIWSGLFTEQNKLVVSDQFGCLSLLKIDGENIKVER